jgi:hypothetical protein
LGDESEDKQPKIRTEPAGNYLPIDYDYRSRSFFLQHLSLALTRSTPDRWKLPLELFTSVFIAFQSVKGFRIAARFLVGFDHAINRPINGG